jgi:hypothetical protein
MMLYCNTKRTHGLLIPVGPEHAGSARVPVTLICGLREAGKISLIDHVLRNAGGRRISRAAAGRPDPTHPAGPRESKRLIRRCERFGRVMLAFAGSFRRPLCLALLSAALWSSVQVTAAAGRSAPTPADAEHSAVNELLDLIGVPEAAAATTKRVVAWLRSGNPRVPAEVWTHYTTRMSNRESILSLYAPIYSRHLSQAQILQLIAFYHSPPGAHLRSVLPAINRENQGAAQQWASEVMLDLVSDNDSSESVQPQLSSPAERVAQDSDARTVAVHALLRESGTLLEARAAMTETLSQLKTSPLADALPPAFWSQAQARLTDEQSLLDLWTPAYRRQLSQADVAALLTFYRSAAGRNFVQALPSIRAECLEAATRQASAAARAAVREVMGPLPQWKLQHPQSAPDTAKHAEP